MAQPYVGEIRLVGFTFAPQGWAFCNGQLLPISEFDTLFNLIGTTYGGDGQNTFALPDLQSRIPFHQGGSLIVGQPSGTETVTLLTSQLPAHTHAMAASNLLGSQPSPANGYWAKSTLGEFSTEPAAHPMAASAITPSGGTQPHNNIPPVLVVNFVISLFGIFPSQS